jgi:altronate dehydratase small subunit
MAQAFRVDARDNVATVLADVTPGPVELVGGDPIEATEAIAHGHKIALMDIPAGRDVIKFGVPIGRASADIPAGAWVHLHNLESFLDERSQTLDLHTGGATDTRYD